MLLIKCEACGGNSLKRHGNVYDCPFCGSRYIMDENEMVVDKVITDYDIIVKIEKSKKLHEANNFAEELELLNECYEKDPDNARILVFLGRCFRSMSQIDRAMEFYSKALEINPNEASAYANMGTIYTLRGDYDKAASVYEKGLPLYDKAEFDYWIAYANYAVSVAKLGNPKKAEEMIKEAEAHGYQKGDSLRQMAGIQKKKGLFSGLKSLF